MSKYADKFNELCDDFAQKTDNLLSEYRNVLSQYEKSFEDAKNSLAKIEDIEKTTTQEKDKFSKNCEELDKIIEDINEKYEDIEKSQKTITTIHNKIVELHSYVYGAEEEKLSPISQTDYAALPSDAKIQKDGKYYKKLTKITPGKKEEIEKFLENISNLKEKEDQKIKERDKKVDEEIQRLLDRIEGLLPGATAAGLTAAYAEARKSTQYSIYFWQACFIISLACIAAIIFFLLYEGIISFSGDLSFEKTIVQVLKLFGCEFPCIWFAWASNIKIAQYTRLREEYRHKWTMTRTFDGMQKAIAQAENISEDHRENFYRSMLEVFADNPSKIFDKKYDPDGPISLWHRLFDKQPSAKQRKKEEAD